MAKIAPGTLPTDPTVEETINNLYMKDQANALKMANNYFSDVNRQRNNIEMSQAAQLGELERPVQTDISPLMALTDQWTGSNLSKGYKPPEDNSEFIAKLQNQINEAQQGLTKEQRQFLSDKLQREMLADDKKAARELKEAMAAKDAELRKEQAAEKAAERRIHERDQRDFMKGMQDDRLAAQKTMQGERLEAKKQARADAPPTQDQVKLAGFALASDDANNVMTGLESDTDADVTGGWSQAQQNAPGWAEGLKSDKVKALQTAQNNFMTSVLRWQSGAAISIPEFDRTGNAYFPKHNDPPEVVAQKQKARQRIIDIMKVGGEKVLNKMGQGGSSGGGDLESLSDDDLIRAANSVGP